MSERPKTGVIRDVHIRDVHIIDGYQYPFVEIFMEIHQNGDACEPLTAEFFPQGCPKEIPPEEIKNAPENEPSVRLLQSEAVNENERQKFKQFAAVVGRITYYHWK